MAKPNSQRGGKAKPTRKKARIKVRIPLPKKAGRPHVDLKKEALKRACRKPEIDAADE